MEINYGSAIPAESIKVIAESVGISTLSDEAAKEISDSATFRLKLVLQESKKFMMHSKRNKLLISDIDSALKEFGVEPIYGFHANQNLPFKYASGDGRELHYTEDRDIDLVEYVNKPLAKVPLDISIRCHWLAIDGVQPIIPENPPPQPIKQNVQSEEPKKKCKIPTFNRETTKRPFIGKPQKLYSTETVHVKELATHELSVEQQLYYKEITEACVGSDESRRTEALQSLATDTGLYEMLPRMSSFIAEGVKINVAQSNLALLIYLMRMVKALLENSVLYLEKYLHEIIPSVLTCIVSKQLCMRPEIDNHWALRDFASRLMAQICKMFNTPTTQIQTRITKVFTNAMYSDNTPLPSIYGAIEGLSELGLETIKLFVIPAVRMISEKLDSPVLSQNNIDRISINQIKQLLCKILTPVLKTAHPENVEEYKKEFGSIGIPLYAAVCKVRATIVPESSSNPTGTQISAQSDTAVGQPVSMSLNNSGLPQKYILMSMLKYHTKPTS